jgi:hypothetical protein
VALAAGDWRQKFQTVSIVDGVVEPHHLAFAVHQ